MRGADARYMACSDLLRALERDDAPTTSVDDVRAIAEVLTRAVFDASSEVAGLAMKCVERVSRTDGEGCARTGETLCAALGGRDAGRRDAAVMCLKTVANGIGMFEVEAREAMVGTCVSALTALAEGATRDGASAEETHVAAEAVDVLHAFATALSAMPHAGVSAEQSEALQATLLRYVERGKSGTRKRAAQCVALLMTFAKEDAVRAKVRTVVSALEEKISQKNKSDLHAFILGATARAVGYRFGDHAEEVIPLLLRACNAPMEEYDEEAIVNVESALQAIESIISSCPSSVRGGAETGARIAVALKYLSYDPNYDDDETEDMDANNDDDDDNDEDDDDVYSDGDYEDEDEDESWKVRRASAKMLSSMMSAAPEATLTEHYDDIMSKLLSRTRDREPSVQLDVFSVISDIVVAARKFLRHDPASPIGAKIRSSLTDVSRIIVRESTSKNPKTQLAAYTLLHSLGEVFPEILSDIQNAEVRDSLVRTVERCIGDKACSSTVRIEALAFVCSVCTPRGFDALEPFVSELLPHIQTACADKYYKVVAEALRSCAALVEILRREEADMIPRENVEHISSLLHTVLAKLDASDEDQDVKEAAIHVCAVMFSKLNDHISAQDQSRGLALLLELSRNETTRLAAVRAFAMIAGASRQLDLSGVIASVTSELTAFLRKANKPLRESSLAALTALISRHRGKLQDQDVVPVVTESSTLMTEEDLHLATMSVGLLTTIASAASAFPKAAADMATTSLPIALQLTRSPLVQRQTLRSLQDLYKNLILAGVVAFRPLLDALSDTSGIQSIDSQFVAHSLAKCVASACVAAGDEATKETMDALLAKLKSSRGIEAVYALLCVGEIGRLTDVTANEELEAILFSAFESYGDEVKGAAALTLGRVAAGNREKYLPIIVSKLADEAAVHQYSLLQSLREVIVVGNLSEQTTGEVLAILYRTASAEEEGVRNVVAECLGRLAATNPSKLVQEIHNRFSTSASALEKATLISAIKFVVLASEKGELTKIRDDLRLVEFMSAISDGDVVVRTAVVKTMNALIHRESALIIPSLPEILPNLLRQTAVVTDLVKVIDLGAFKHTVDDGLECRKSVFECINTILDSCPSLVSARDVVSAITSGLGDHYDVKMLAHAALRKLSDGVAPNSVDAVLSSLDAFAPHLEKTLTARVKSDAVQQEIDRNNDLLRSALRTVRSINQHAANANAPAWKTLNEETIAGKENLARFYAEVEKGE